MTRVTYCGVRKADNTMSACAEHRFRAPRQDWIASQTAAAALPRPITGSRRRPARREVLSAFHRYAVICGLAGIDVSPHRTSCAASLSVVVPMLALQTTSPSCPYLAIASRLSIGAPGRSETRPAHYGKLG